MSDQQKYIINFDKILGSGVTADVYLGIRSADGYQCALKCFRNTKSATQYNHVMANEVSIMKDLDHENIIKFYESISNLDRFQRVIAMEYCNQGSLYEFAELHQGLCDNMFMKVLECLNQGIYYLRGKKLLHRDIKPGNMMVHQDDMGYYHVKLGDMGTTKRVADDGTFTTLVGTQEYLHPDMFIQYLEGMETSFKVSVDLWSTGVTLYHAASTKLPFVPFKYSRIEFTSKNTLKEMYMSKKPGIISGQQMSSRPDDIVWSEKLPTTCRLSPMLNDLASKLIGNLMDLSDENTYDRFFDNANNLSNKKRILVFNSLNGDLLILYLDTLTYNNVIDIISQSIGFHKDDLIILTRNKVLAPLEDPNAECLRSIPVKGHMRYTLTDDTVLVVVRKFPLNIQPLACKHIPISQCDSPHPHYAIYERVKKYSRDVMRSIYQIGYTANYIDCQLDCFLATMFSFNQYVLVDDLRLVHEAKEWQLVAARDSCDKTRALLSLAEVVITDLSTYTNVCNGIMSYRQSMEEMETKIKSSDLGVDDYYDKFVKRREMFKYTNENFYNISDPKSNDGLDFLVHSAEELVNEMMVIPESKVYESDDTYKLEVWQRHIRLFKFYQVATERRAAKSARVSDAHKYFCKIVQEGLKLIVHFANWKNTLGTVNDDRGYVSDIFGRMIDWWKNLSPNTDESDALKTRILEIQGLLDKVATLGHKEDIGACL